MSWLNLNQSLSSLKGQITNFASEVLAEGPAQDSGDIAGAEHVDVNELQDKINHQLLEISALKQLNDELQAALQAEKISRKNGVTEDEPSWYWDPPAQTAPKKNESAVSNLKEDSTRVMNDEIHKLKEENKNLTSSLEDLDSQHQFAMEKLLTLKKELQKNFEVLKQEHEELKTTNDHYSEEIKKIQSLNSQKDKEIEQFKVIKSDYDTLQHKYQNLERVHSLLKENTEKFQEENQDLHEEVFKLQEQVTKLEHEIEVSVKHSELSDVVPRERYEDILKELNDLRKSRTAKEMLVEESNIDDNAKGVIESLKREISDLKHKLEHNNVERYLDTSDPKYVKTDTILRLYDQYINFELPVDYVWNIPSSGDNTVMYKLEGVFKTLHEFKKDIDSLEHAITEKGLNEKHLQTQIDELTSENDLLTTDVQTYYAELSEMKKNNDFLLSEITNMKNVSKLQPIIESHEDNLVKLESELANSTKINESFQSQIKRIEVELSEVQAEKISLVKSLSDLKDKYNGMLQEFEFYKEQSKQTDDLQRNMESERLHETEREIEELKTRVISAEAKNEQLAIDIKISENIKILLMKDVDDLKTELDQNSRELKKLILSKSLLENKCHEYENRMNVGALSEQISPSNVSATLEGNKKEIKREEASFENILYETNTESQYGHGDITECNIGTTIDWKKQFETLKKQENKLLAELQDFKNNSFKEQSTFNAEITDLKNKNEDLEKAKSNLESKLLLVEEKVVAQENNLSKLSSDILTKDMQVESLTADYNKIISELKSNIHKVNEELESRNTSISELNDKLNDSYKQIKISTDLQGELEKEKNDINKKLFDLKAISEEKDVQLYNLRSKVTELDNALTHYKVQLDNKDQEIKELNQSLFESKEKINSDQNTTLYNNDEISKYIEETKTLTELLRDKDEKLKDALSKCERMSVLEAECNKQKDLIEKATTEKSEYINLITVKHNESIQYHNEIQRLNQVILEQTNEFKRLYEEKERQLKMYLETCKNCANCNELMISIKEKDEIIASMRENVAEYDRIQTELTHAKETISQLSEKCENLDKSLTIQLETVKGLTAEKDKLSEQEQSLARELDRLRRHLVETEEHYTQELMTSEQKLTECTTRLHNIEERAKQSSNAYTSNSIRANQEVETLRNQIRLLEKQREEGQHRLSEVEDAKGRSEAALTNLQVVLEQFQQDKERDIAAATERLKNKIDDMHQKNNILNSEIDRLNAKLNESLAGLQAAARLGDQLETKSAQINDYKEQVKALQISVQAAEERYYNTISNQQDKVDKNLVKNLVMNYVQSASQSTTNRTQVLRVLSTVLDFNQKECERLGLVRSQNNTHDSFATEFVRFLEKESQPAAPLPTMMGLTSVPSRATTPSIAGSPQLTEQRHKRNTSSGSNNLLFQNIDNADTASQISTEAGSAVSDHKPIMFNPVLDSGVNQTRNNEGAILKQVLKDMSN